MTQRALTGGVALMTLTAVLTAHAQTPTQMPKAGDAHAKVTVQGCLDRSPGAGATSGASPADGRASADTSFLLIPIATPAGGQRAAADTSQKPGAGAMGGGSLAGMQNVYRLTADASTLSAHVGHKVELTGVVDTQASAPATPTSSTAPTLTATMNAPMLMVEGVKMLASNCMGT